MREHDLVILLAPPAGYALVSGSVGTVVHIHADRAAIEAEFSADDGVTRAVLTLPPASFRALGKVEGR